MPTIIPFVDPSSEGYTTFQDPKISEFSAWVIDFDKEGGLKEERPVGVTGVIGSVRTRFANSSRAQHLFVFVHGVAAEFKDFCGYIEWFRRFYDQYPQAETSIHREDITILGVNWKSQDMGSMLKSLFGLDDPKSVLSPDKQEKMPAQKLAENGLKAVINEVTKGLRVSVHLVAHSMGAQVLLYLLPQLGDHVEIGSMMFLQGFAPSSAFGGPVAKQHDRFQHLITKTADEHILKGLYAELAKGSFRLWEFLDLLLNTEPRFAPPRVGWNLLKGFLRDKLWTVDLDLEVAKRVIHPSLKTLTSNVIKVTQFQDHLGKVKGPILATTTETLWADYQVGVAEVSFYSPPGVLGVRGFEGDDVEPDVHVHDSDEDEIEGGDRSYNFAKAGKRFFNLRAGPYITDHDDFKNRAIAYVHARAAGLIDDNVVAQAREKRKQQGRVAPQPLAFRPDRWMNDTWGTISTRSLRQVCMPGSHDAGMGIADVYLSDPNLIAKGVDDYVKDMAHSLEDKTHSDKDVEDKAHPRTELEELIGILTSGPIKLLRSTAIEMARAMVPRLSVTQVSPIREQMLQGCRFFDLRPAWTSNGFYLAHGEHQRFTRASGKTGVDLGFIGGIGEPLDAVLDGVAKFAAEAAHSRELIVLKFSHAADWHDKADPALKTEQKKTLFDLIRNKLGDVMIDGPDPAKRLDDISLKDLLDMGRVLCIYEKALAGDAPTSDRPKGVYWYGPSDGNYWLCDEYANSRNPAFVIGDQWWKFKTRRRDQVFLLSWTSTLTPSLGVVMDLRSIIDHAKDLNARLRPCMETWIRRGDIDGANRPNIIYVDAYDAKVLDTVTMINAL